jgi:hypothetical protein
MAFDAMQLVGGALGGALASSILGPRRAIADVERTRWPPSNREEFRAAVVACRAEALAAAADRERSTPLMRLGNTQITPLSGSAWLEAKAHPDPPGQKSGRRSSTPIQLVIDDGGRWLVAPYGGGEWVRNMRIAGEVDLKRAGRMRRPRIEELGPSKPPPVLREYLRTTPIVKLAGN